MTLIDSGLERLRGLDVSSLADADKQLRVMSHEIVRMNPGPTLVGTALTIRCTQDFFAMLDALEQAAEGDVLVVDAQGSPTAVAGELMATEALRRGLAGIVIDGLCRDVAGIRRLPLPVYARGCRPNAGTAGERGELRVPIRCGGVAVETGEVIFGDDDGVLVAAADELNAALPAAETIQRREDTILERMRAGSSLFESLDIEPVRTGEGGPVWRP